MRQKVFAWALSGAALLFASNVGAATRDEVARKWAPILLQETNDPIKDLLTAYDFDGNWNGDDNAENMKCWSDPSQCDTGDNPKSACAGQKCPLVATVYYTVVETKTHWFVQYMPYHPLDWKVTNGHEHDTESVLAVVKKDGGTGKLQALETRFHLYWYQYGDGTVKDSADDVDATIHFDTKSGRPMIYSQMVGHGLCGGFSPPNRLFPDLSITCNHGDTPHIDQTGVVYSPDLPAKMPVVQDGKVVETGYALVDLATSVWPHIKEIGKGKTFQNAIDFGGERCSMFTCPTSFGGNWEGNEGSSPGEPWAQEGGKGVSANGDQFFDPAYTMSKRLAFPAEFSLEYCSNPYLGIADTCGDAPSDAGADAADDAFTAPEDDAGTDATDDAATGANDANRGDAALGATTGSSGGCGCSVPARSTCSPAFASLAIAALVALRRRR